MAQPDDLEARVSALETGYSELAKEVRGTKQDAAAARLLAGAADRDVSEFRAEIRDFRNATTASFNAVREDHLDLHRKVDDGFARADREFTQIDRNFGEVRGRLDATAAGLQHVTTLLNTLIARHHEE